MSVTTGTRTPELSTSHLPDAETPRPRHIRHLYGALAGTTFEVFDWSIYSLFAAFFATSFFASKDVAAFLGANIVFAVGFIARPVGSLIFGRISDKRGRKASLFATSATALVGTLMIALSPTQQSIGVGATIVLISARIIQGIAHGGEQPAAGAYLAELSTPRNRGLVSSWVYVAATVGSLLGTLLGAVLSSTLGAQALINGGWRIAFGVGALGSLYAVFLTTRLPETTIFQDSREETAPARIVGEMARSWRPALLIVGLTIGTTIAFQNWVAMPGYHIAVFGSNPTSVLWAAAAAQLITIISLPLWGALSDRIGRKPVLYIGFVGTAITTFPFMTTLDGSATRMFITVTVSLVLLSAPLSILPTLMAELVPTSIRTIGVGFSYAIATAIFGGTVSALQTWIGNTWGPKYFGIYVTLSIIVSILFILFMPETRDKDLKAESTTRSINLVNQEQ